MELRRLQSLKRARAASSISEETVFHVLRNRRRRYALHYLKQRGETVSVGQLAEQVAAWENDTPVEAVSSTERKRVYISLLQSHLPTLDEAGMVDFDDSTSTVGLTEAARNVDIYVELVSKNDNRWPRYYLALAAVSAVFVVGVWSDVEPLTAVPDVVWFGLVVALFTLTASIHHVYSRRIRLGSDGPPPECEG